MTTWGVDGDGGNFGYWLFPKVLVGAAIIGFAEIAAAALIVIWRTLS